MPVRATRGYLRLQDDRPALIGRAATAARRAHRARAAIDGTTAAVADDAALRADRCARLRHTDLHAARVRAATTAGHAVGAHAAVEDHTIVAAIARLTAIEAELRARLGNAHAY